MVGSVRGTIFATETKNGESTIYGIKDKVHIQVIDPKSRIPIDGATADISSQEKIAFRKSTIVKARKALIKEALADTDLDRPIFLRGFREFLDEKDLSDQQIQQIITRLEKREKLRGIRPPVRKVTPTPLPSPTIKPTPFGYP